MSERIAVMILGPLGDVINTSGIFKKIRKNYPNSEISIITTNRGVPATKGIPEIDNVYFIDKSKPNYNKNLDTIKLGLSLRNKFDTVIVLDNSLRCAIGAFLTGAKHRIGRGRELRELFLTDIIPYKKEEKNGEIHVSEHYARCLKPLGLYEENIDTYFEFSKEDENRVNELLKTEDVVYTGEGGDVTLVGICPACHRENKSINIKDTEELIQKINQLENHKVIIVGGNDISDYVSKLKENNNLKFYDFTGKTSFTETAALISKCNKFISVDTSCMHLAFARKVPTVAIFFTKLFKKWGPKDLKNNDVFVNLNSKKIDVDLIVEKLKNLGGK